MGVAFIMPNNLYISFRATIQEAKINYMFSVLDFISSVAKGMINNRWAVTRVQ